MIYFTWIPCPTRRVLKEFMSFKKNFTCTLNVKVVIGWYNFDSTHIVNNNNLWCSGYKMCTPRTMIQDSADPLLSEDPLLSANPLLSEDPLLALLFVWKITIWFYSMLPTLPSELTILGPLIFLLKNKIPSHMKKIDISCILHLLICFLPECVCVC